MKTFDVTIRATVTKTLKIQAATEDAAVEQAHEEFTTVCDGGDESYDENMLNVVQVADDGNDEEEAENTSSYTFELVKTIVVTVEAASYQTALDEVLNDDSGFDGAWDRAVEKAKFIGETL